MAVLVGYPGGRGTFDVPRESLPKETRAGDVFEVRFVRGQTGQASAVRRLLDELLGRGEGNS